MRVPLPPQSAVVKRVLPRSLLGRTLLIVLVPLIVVQVVALQIFYGSHLDIVSRRLSSGIAGEIGTTINLLGRFSDPADQAWVLQTAWNQYELRMRFEPGASLPPGRQPAALSPLNAGLSGALADKLSYPFSIDWRSDPESVLIGVQMPDGIARHLFPVADEWPHVARVEDLPQHVGVQWSLGPEQPQDPHGRAIGEHYVPVPVGDQGRKGLLLPENALNGAPHE